MRSNFGRKAFKALKSKNGGEDHLVGYSRRIAASGEFGALARSLSSQPFDVREIVGALLDAPVVARLVLCADKAVRATAAVRRHLKNVASMHAESSCAWRHSGDAGSSPFAIHRPAMSSRTGKDDRQARLENRSRGHSTSAAR